MGFYPPLPYSIIRVISTLAAALRTKPRIADSTGS